MPGRTVLDTAIDTDVGRGWHRSERSVVDAVRRLQRNGTLELPFPAQGATVDRWSRLAALGRTDLCLARLAEGHVDAVAIINESGRPPVPGVVYGVWASRSGGRTVLAGREGSRWTLDGTIPFCSGAGLIDRALIAAFPAGEDGEPDPRHQLLFDVDLSDPAVCPEPGSWPALGMDATCSLDVRLDALHLADECLIGRPGSYTSRPGFHLGGAGVAAVWLGGAAGAVDTIAGTETSDPHRLALTGRLLSELAAADALIARTAAEVDDRPDAGHLAAVLQCRAVAENVARRAIEVVPMVVGPARLSEDRRLAQHLADLQLYIGQYHTGADLARVAEALARRPKACR